MASNSILVVDDDEIVLQAISSRLKKKGFLVESINSGVEAIRIFEKGVLEEQASNSNKTPYDLVITDLMMEGIGGIKLLERIKQLHPGTMVMILTGHGDLQTAIEALRLGADEYLLKSCKSEELFFRVARCIEKLEFQRKIQIYERLLPVCCVCKKIRDDEGKEKGRGSWFGMEEYLRDKACVGVTHTYCHNCADVFRGELKSAKI